MESDKRYAGKELQFDGGEGETAPVAEGGFSIRGMAKAGRPAYLDVQATTPMDPRVLDAMMPHMMHQVWYTHRLPRPR